MMRFSKELYPKVALLKAAYNFTDVAYIHLDSDEHYYYVELLAKDNCREISEQDFHNEILTQSLRHEIYMQTKNIRELMLARAMATSLVSTEENGFDSLESKDEEEKLEENDILKDWFADENA